MVDEVVLVFLDRDEELLRSLASLDGRIQNSSYVNVGSYRFVQVLRLLQQFSRLANNSSYVLTNLVRSPELQTSSLFDFVKVQKVFYLYDTDAVKTVEGMTKALIPLLHDVGRNLKRFFDLGTELVCVRTEFTARIS